MSQAVTVVIPVFNGGRFLAATIESLLAQTHRDFTVVCLDDQSTDDSVAIAQSFRDARLHVERNVTRRGLAGNWNEAIAIARTPLLVIAHQDDLYEPHYLEAAAQLLEAHPRAFIAHTRATYIDEEGQPVDSTASRSRIDSGRMPEPYEREPSAELRALHNGNYIICPSAMYRMSAVAGIGDFNEHYRFVPDWEYWFRGLQKGFTITGSHARLAHWRRHEESATRHEEATLRRYDEELELLEWLSRTAGMRDRKNLVENTLLSDFATRLANGDRTGAAALRRYTRERLPKARRNRALMQLAELGGPLAGRALKIAEAIYVRFAKPA